MLLSRTPGSANARQIDCQPQGVKTDRQGEGIDVQAFLRSNQEPQHAGDRELDAGAMRAARQRPACGNVILADGIRRHR